MLAALFLFISGTGFSFLRYFFFPFWSISWVPKFFWIKNIYCTFDIIMTPPFFFLIYFCFRPNRKPPKNDYQSCQSKSATNFNVIVPLIMVFNNPKPALLIYSFLPGKVCAWFFTVLFGLCLTHLNTLL